MEPKNAMTQCKDFCKKTCEQLQESAKKSPFGVALKPIANLVINQFCSFDSRLKQLEEAQIKSMIEHSTDQHISHCCD